MVLTRAVALFLLLTTCVLGQTVECYFSPKGGAERALIAEIGQAKRTVDCAIYCLNHPQIAQAIVDAHRRGVRVRMIFDKVQAAGKTSLHGQVASAEIPLQIRRGSGGGVMHDKVAVIDRATVCTGSFNWTVPATERNDENLLIVHDKATAAKFAGQFEMLWRRP